MKLTLNKRGQVVVVEKKSRRQKPKTKISKYQKYKAYAQQEKIDYILTESEYKTTEARNKEKHRRVTPANVVRWQKQGGHTDKQINAMVRAARRHDSSITKAQFVRQKAWIDIQKEASDLYEKLKMEDPNLTTGEISRIISQQIYGSL